MLLKHTHKNLLKAVEGINGLENMSIAEKLFKSDLAFDFDMAMLCNVTRAKQILQALKVDAETIERIINHSGEKTPSNFNQISESDQ